MSNNKQVWFITGAARGLGLDLTKAVLAAGHVVVGTARDCTNVTKAVGASDDLLALTLDVTKPDDAVAAVKAAVARFGRIDVVVNNAANFFAGYFEELTPQQIEAQLATTLFGPMHVTRAVLPVLRQQGSGRLIAISSTAGFSGFEFGTAYGAAKYALEGFMESLHAEVSPFSIETTVVNPGFFRTELLTEQSTQFAAPSIDAYTARREPLQAFWTSQNGLQGGDPKKLAQAIVTIAAQSPAPRRFIAGADAIAAAEAQVKTRLEQIDSQRALSTSLAFDEA